MQKEREKYAKYTRRSACNVNVHFMHSKFLQTGKISSNLYFNGYIRTRLRMRIEEDRNI